MKFKEYVDREDRESLKQAVLEFLGATEDALDEPLSNFKKSGKVLEDPGVQQFLSKSKNQSAVANALSQADQTHLSIADWLMLFNSDEDVSEGFKDPPLDRNSEDSSQSRMRRRMNFYDAHKDFPIYQDKKVRNWLNNVAMGGARFIYIKNWGPMQEPGGSPETTNQETGEVTDRKQARNGFGIHAVEISGKNFKPLNNKDIYFSLRMAGGGDEREGFVTYGNNVLVRLTTVQMPEGNLIAMMSPSRYKQLLADFQQFKMRFW